jgi:hypothetical protein
MLDDDIVSLAMVTLDWMVKDVGSQFHNYQHSQALLWQK